MTNPTVNALGDWSPFEGHRCSPGSCDCVATAPDDDFELLAATAPWLDAPLDERLYPYVPRAFQA